jgi:hypothetical protein
VCNISYVSVARGLGRYFTIVSKKRKRYFTKKGGIFHKISRKYTQKGKKGCEQSIISKKLDRVISKVVSY